MRDAREVLAASLLLMLGLSACGGDDDAPAADGAPLLDAPPDTTDISGWYQVDSEREGECGATEVGVAPPAYVWVEPFSGIFYLHYCSGTEEADCDATPFYDFTRAIEGGWAAEGGSAFFSADCTLSWERTEATLSGAELQVDSLRYSIVESIPERQCTLEAAAALTDPCTYEIEITATRL